MTDWVMSDNANITDGPIFLTLLTFGLMTQVTSLKG